MANFLDLFQKEAIGGEGRIEDFTANINSRGDFTKIRELDVILNSWNNVLQTPQRSYTFDPEYGSKLQQLIFEPADESTIDAIVDEVEECLSAYDSRAKIESIDVQFLKNRKGFSVNVVVSYKGKTGSFSTIITEEDVI